MRTSRIFPLVVICILLLSSAGCGPLTPVPSPTPSASPTRTPAPTAANTATPTASPTPTFAPLPTSVLKNDPAAVPLTDECRSVMDNMQALKQELGLPDHFMNGEPARQASDFDPGLYFQVLPGLKLQSGYVLDYLYFADDLGGKPLLYARKAKAAPFPTYEDLLKAHGEEISGERSYAPLAHTHDFLDQVQVSGTPGSYFQFITLALLGDQFYLSWHANYNDTLFLCDAGDLQYVNRAMQGFQIELPADIAARAAAIDFTPTVAIGETTITVRFVTFTKWGGFFENVYVLKKGAQPIELIDAQWHPLVEYDCGISF